MASLCACVRHGVRVRAAGSGSTLGRLRTADDTTHVRRANMRLAMRHVTRITRHHATNLPKIRVALIDPRRFAHASAIVAHARLRLDERRRLPFDDSTAADWRVRAASPQMVVDARVHHARLDERGRDAEAVLVARAVASVRGHDTGLPMRIEACVARVVRSGHADRTRADLLRTMRFGRAIVQAVGLAARLDG